MSLFTETEMRERAATIRATNDEKRFDKPTWANFLSKAMLVVTELDEAVQSIEAGGQRNLGEELADAWIRLVDMLEAMFQGTWSTRGAGYDSRFQPLEAILWPTLRWLCQGAESWRKGPGSAMDVRICLEYAVASVEATARATGEDLAFAIDAKMAKNAARPVLHGKVESA